MLKVSNLIYFTLPAKKSILHVIGSFLDIMYIIDLTVYVIQLEIKNNKNNILSYTMKYKMLPALRITDITYTHLKKPNK